MILIMWLHIFVIYFLWELFLLYLQELGINITFFFSPFKQIKMIESFLFKIVLRLISIIIAELFVTTYLTVIFCMLVKYFKLLFIMTYSIFFYVVSYV